MGETRKPKQRLRVRITAEAEFELDQLEDLIAWQDSIKEYGTIFSSEVEVVG